MNHNQRGLFQLEGCHTAHHQVGAGLGRVIDPDVEPGPDAGAHNQNVFGKQLGKGGFQGIEHLGNHGGNNGALDFGGGNIPDCQQHFQINGVFVGGFGGVCTEPGLKNNGFALHGADGNIGISDIHRKDHVSSSKSAPVRIRQSLITPFSSSSHPAVPP